jgi:hypothetical protein
MLADKEFKLSGFQQEIIDSGESKKNPRLSTKTLV